MRSSLRQGVLRALAALGVFRLFRFLNRRKVAIVYYHGVTASERFEGILNHEGKHVRLSRFREQLRFLGRHYRVRPLPEVLEALRGRAPLAPRTAVITFDDGYENNATVALAALREAGSTATFFLTTSLIGTDRCLWVDELEQVLASTALPEVTVRTRDGAEHLPLRTDEHRRAAYARMRVIGTQLPEVEMRAWLDAFFADNGFDRPKASGDYRLMTWDHARALRAAGMTIGSHTLTHAIVARMSVDEMAREVNEARRACEEALGEPCDTFAYPNGRLGDFDDRATALLERLGFSCGLTTVNGLNRTGADVYTLKRVGAGDGTTIAELEAQMSGFLAWALRVRRRSGR